jgi:ribonuclease H / adenosylcobalamin/alpha-ribazole phosphatase
VKVVVEADGGSRGNPGNAGYGAVVLDPDSGDVLAERSAALGVTTNNVAEYSGLIAGLKAAAELGADEVDVRMDSKLVVEQMAGRWQIKHPGLRPLAAEAAALVSRFRAVRFTWIPREQNKHADQLANAAMDGVAATPLTRPAPPSSWEPRESADPLRMLLVRHGASTLNAQKRYSGRVDVPLSDLGVSQAAAVGARIAELTTDLHTVVSSPLSRAQDTAAAIARAAGDVPVLTDDDLIECDFGDWEGLTFAEVREQYPAELDAWLASPAVPPPGGESFQVVALRTRRAVKRLREQYEGRTIAVVSHVTPIKLMLRDALAAGDMFLHRLYLDPAGLSIVDSWPDGGIAVRTVNDTSHVSAGSGSG